jgi:hypothetical protein
MLNRLGLDLHHEGVGEDGAVSWFFAINAHSIRDWPGTHTIDLQTQYIINNPTKLTFQRFRHVFHQVRHPLRVIATLVNKCAVFDRWWGWIAQASGFEVLSKPATPLKRAMLLYLLWNRHIELYADLRYVMEVTSPRDVCVWANFSQSLCSVQMVSASKNTNKASEILAKQRLAGGKRRYRELSRRFNPDRTNRTHRTLPGMSKKAEVVGADKYNRAASRRSINVYLSSTNTNSSAITNQKISWQDLDEEDLILANQIRIMCLEYRMPLDPEKIPQSNDTIRFHA